MLTPSALRIKLRCASWQQLATIYKRDLIRGTMFLRAASPPSIGTLFRIDLALPSGTIIELAGAVERYVEGGLELKLAPVAAEAMWIVESALAAEYRPARPPPLPSALAPSSGVPSGKLPPTASGPIPSVADGADVAAAEAELVRALLAEVGSLKGLNPFLVLGLGYEASDADVRKAFGDLTKRYHPDRFARYESAEVRAVAAEIFILIRDAYRRIAGEAARAQVLASLGRARHTVAIPAAPAPRPAGSADEARPRPRKIPTAQVPVVSATPMLRTAVVPPKPVPAPAPAPAATVAAPDGGDLEALDALLDQQRLDEALTGYRYLAKKRPNDRAVRAGIELCEGLLALRLRDRLEAAQRFEAALEIDPNNERAAVELAEMRRQATQDRKGLLSRLMGRPGGTRDE